MRGPGVGHSGGVWAPGVATEIARVSDTPRCDCFNGGSMICIEKNDHFLVKLYTIKGPLIKHTT